MANLLTMIQDIIQTDYPDKAVNPKIAEDAAALYPYYMFGCTSEDKTENGFFIKAINQAIKGALKEHEKEIFVK